MDPITFHQRHFGLCLQPPEHLDGVDDADVRVAEVVEAA